MAVEPLVLGEDERILHELRDLRDLHERAALEPDLRDESAVGRIHLRRLTRRVRVENLDGRTSSFTTDEYPARVGHAASERDAERQREEHDANELRIALREPVEPRRLFHRAEATNVMGNREPGTEDRRPPA